MNPDIIRRGVIGIVGLLITGIIIWAGYEFVYKGTLLIEGADTSLSVVVTGVDGGVVARGTDNQYRLTPGSYLVSAATNTAGASKVVDIGVLSTTTLKIGDIKIMNASVAVKAPIYGVIPAGKWLLGYEVTTEFVKRFDGQGNSSDKLGSPAPIGEEDEWDTEIHDRTTSYQGYVSNGALVASTHALFSIQGQGVNPITTEGIDVSGTSLPELVIGSNQSQESFVVGCKGVIYSFQNTLSKAQKVFEGKKLFDQIAYGGDYAIAYSTVMPNAYQDIRSFYEGYQVDANVVNIKNQQTFTLPGPLSGATISPGGAYATIKPRDGQPYLYDLAAKKRITTIDQANAALPYWNGNKSFIYEKGKQVWQYNVEKRSADLLARVDHHITSFSGDGKGGYFATYYEGIRDNGVLLISATAPAAITTTTGPKLDNILPYTGEDFAISYTNIGTPTITISTFAILNRADQIAQYRAATQALRQKALDYLTSQKINLTGITIVYDPADPL